ncbi:MAG: DUF2089 family protein [Anaerolineae bacterium]
MPNPILGHCPVCGERLEATRLHCHNCDTTIEGHFSLGRIYMLSDEQLAFVETFIRCEGKINKVEEELGISYPTVRGRLYEVIRALGYEVGEEPAPSPEQRRQVLEQLAQGQITAEDALKQLKGK